MSANQITSIEAILNGTSNYILTQMFSHNASYEDAVQSAQEIGYAEADPAMDVDGTDAAQKLGILVQLALGIKVGLDQFLRQGIDGTRLSGRFTIRGGIRIHRQIVGRSQIAGWPTGNARSAHVDSQ